MKWLERHKVFLYQNYLLYAIAFLIPLFPRLVPLSILLLGLLSLYSIFRGFSRVQLSEVSLLMLIFFGMHGIGLLYTDNFDRGLFDLEVKLSLFAFPIVFVGFRFVNTTNYHRILRAFLYGSLASVSFCLLQSAYKVLILGSKYYHFLTSRFSVIVHQNYYALYLIFSLVILIYLYWQKRSSLTRKQVFWATCQFVLLSLGVVLTGSKTGFIMWILTLLGVTVLLIREMQQKWIPVLALVAMTTGVAIMFQSVPLLQQRIVHVLEVAQSDEVNPGAKESTALRYLVYSATWDVIMELPWYGEGAGDVQDVLDQTYTERGYTQAADRHLNAHNLFLQSWLSLGVPGFMMVLGLFILLIVQAIRMNDPVQIGFTLLFLIISFTESSFNVQAGVVFFSFFAVLLARRNKSTSGDPELEEEAD
jgi:O-antigen ligase